MTAAAVEVAALVLPLAAVGAWALRPRRPTPALVRAGATGPRRQQRGR